MICRVWAIVTSSLLLGSACETDFPTRSDRDTDIATESSTDDWADTSEEDDVDRSGFKGGASADSGDDACPLDPKKTQPGECGCGKRDLDRDGDGVFDCLDSCPFDPEKKKPGACGCGNVERDLDGDGVYDCADLCPDDPEKIGPGACGCGVSDELTRLYPDCDGDGGFSSIAHLACDSGGPDGNFHCDDGQGPDGGWSTLAGDDCDDEDPALSKRVAWYPDCDGDSVYSSVPTYACDALQADAAFACAGGQDPWGGWSKVAGTDCDDEASTVYEVSSWYADCDGDGFYGLAETRACGNKGADAAFDCLDGGDPDGSWSKVAGTDYDDEDSELYCRYGDQDNDGDSICEPAHGLHDAEGLPNIVVEFELWSGTYPLYVDGEYDGGGWVLIGRGREDWKWSESGRGDLGGLSKGLGTKSAFNPVYLPTSVVQELIDNAGIDLTEVEIRIKRAAKDDGSAYQETRWRSLKRPDWTWLFDTQPYPIEYTVFDSALGPGGGTESAWSTSSQAFVTGDDHTKTFTSPNASSSFENAFSFGKTVRGSIGLVWGTFLYCNKLFGCDRAIPYAEVYIRVARDR